MFKRSYIIRTLIGAILITVGILFFIYFVKAQSFGSFSFWFADPADETRITQVEDFDLFIGNGKNL
ncbi:hypothetical protein CL633_02365, partial [bacterium]|nr:hypothetical protein [bacterium]